LTREITIVTPENVTITYELAGLGSRAIACLIDTLLQAAALIVLFAVLAFILFRLMALAPGSAFLRAISDFAVGIVIIAGFLTLAGYFIYFEATRNGQTPGKRWLGLRVVREEGAPIDFSSAVVRNLIRLIELALGSYLISIISILVSAKYKRIGDYAAGTIVVKERSPTMAAPEARPVPRMVPHKAEAAFVRDVDLLTQDEVAAIRRFAERRWELNARVQEDLARQIAEPIMARLGIARPPAPFSWANFLEEVYKRCMEERGAL
jgi:uncharacterized RDD family membrane protein YckC